MLADDIVYVIGVDTHTDVHALAFVEAATQRPCRQLTIVASRRGYRQALRARVPPCSRTTGVGA
jgi:hypothetical protein